MWNNRYEFLPTREAIVAPELACNLKYKQWFRVYGKPYLLGEEERSRQPHTRRPRWALINPRLVRRVHRQHLYKANTDGRTPPSHYVSSYSNAYTNPVIFTQALYFQPHFSTSTLMLGLVFGPLSSTYYTLIPSIFPTTMMPTTTYRLFMIWAPTERSVIMPLVYGTQYSYTPMLMGS